MNKTLVAVVLALASVVSTGALADSIDLTKNELTVDWITIGDTTYYGVVVRLDKFAVLSVDNSFTTPPAGEDVESLPVIQPLRLLTPVAPGAECIVKVPAPGFDKSVCPVVKR